MKTWVLVYDPATGWAKWYSYEEGWVAARAANKAVASGVEVLHCAPLPDEVQTAEARRAAATS